MAGAVTRVSVLRRAAGLVVVLGFLIVAVVFYRVAPTLPRSSAAEPLPSTTGSPREDASPSPTAPATASPTAAPNPSAYSSASPLAPPSTSPSVSSSSSPRPTTKKLATKRPRRVCPTAPGPRCRGSC